jgi:N-methylhydantoinase A
MVVEPSMQAGARWRVGVDVGGTFTDLVLSDADGAVFVFKVPSVPDDPAAGVMAAVERAATALSVPVGELLEGCALFVHGSTIATNTLIEHKGAKVGLLATEGFRDSLEIRRGIRDNPWEHRVPYPPVLVPRYLRLPAAGRIDRDGEEVAPPVTADLERALATFGKERVDSVAICLFNSFLNPAHERRTAGFVRQRWDGHWISVSSDIAPTMGEYERGSTTVVNAYVAPRTVGYLRTLNQRLRELGFRHSMLLIQNNGGAISVDQVAHKPVTLLLSGPAAGVGALQFYSRAVGSGNLISMEIGGTSCDVILMDDGRVAVSDELQVAGYHLAVPSVDVHTIGAGGGTIAGVDGAGLMYVGPRGAGARPGPACYGLGGTEPTVTDAQLVLGRLRPGGYAGGSLVLDQRLAREAIDAALARPLGLAVEAAAAGIIRLLEQQILHAVQKISLQRGYDPRAFTLVAAGGAGPMHGASVGRMLGCTKLYVPRLSGVFCALGMLHADVRHDFVRVHLARLDQADPAALDGMFADLEGQAREMLEADGFAPSAMGFARELDLRYVGQQWGVRIRLEEPVGIAREPVREAFEAEHERLFGHHQPGGIIEITALRAVGVGVLPPLHPAAGAPADGPAAAVERRRVFADPERGWVDLDVYRGADLHPGHRLDGPLLVEEETTTVFVGPDDALAVDAANNFVIHLGH